MIPGARTAPPARPAATAFHSRSASLPGAARCSFRTCGGTGGCRLTAGGTLADRGLLAEAPWPSRTEAREDAPWPLRAPGAPRPPGRGPGCGAGTARSRVSACRPPAAPSPPQDGQRTGAKAPAGSSQSNVIGYLRSPRRTSAGSRSAGYLDHVEPVGPDHMARLVLLRDLGQPPGLLLPGAAQPLLEHGPAVGRARRPAAVRSRRSRPRNRRRRDRVPPRWRRCTSAARAWRRAAEAASMSRCAAATAVQQPWSGRPGRAFSSTSRAAQPPTRPAGSSRRDGTSTQRSRLLRRTGPRPTARSVTSAPTRTTGCSTTSRLAGQVDPAVVDREGVPYRREQHVTSRRQ